MVGLVVGGWYMVPSNTVLIQRRQVGGHVGPQPTFQGLVYYFSIDLLP
ncbi:hypothetical protein Pan153_35040 [Gimesia panareensis]|uniref:Uncharacterized protein n=1 Tax=Gimesia panareensis TaxID=2527978 RepID=A0A518FR70_9PLAN|nr:hypothetical protein Pan153_35040 [Gimesia panareensis]